MEQKDKKLTTIVRGYPVSCGFTEKPQKELSGKIRGILLDAFLAQNSGVSRAIQTVAGSRCS